MMKGLGLEGERIQGKGQGGRRSWRSVASLCGAVLRLCIFHNENMTWGQESSAY